MSTPTPSPSPPNRRLFQFRLQTLLTAVLLIAVGLGWWLDNRRLKSQVRLLEERNSLLAKELKSAQTTWSWSSDLETSKLKFAGAKDFMVFVREEPDWYQFQEAQRVFSQQPTSGEAVPALIELLHDPDDKLRVRGASALGVLKARGDLAVPALISALQDKVPNVRWHAISALEKFGAGAKSALPALEAQMNDDESLVATQAALSLKQIDPSIDIGPRLVQLLDNQHQENRWRALEALPRHVAQEVAEPILTRMYEQATDATVRESIARTLNVYSKQQPSGGTGS